MVEDFEKTTPSRWRKFTLTLVACGMMTGAQIQSGGDISWPYIAGMAIAVLGFTFPDVLEKGFANGALGVKIGN